jgi:ATP-dependent exoDNAse (exonuclease V) beta subunit
MTIHAAKGLEFPVVFVVNLHVGGRGRGSGITVSERGPDGLSDVTFGSSEATRLEDARDTEELKRLLYVAVTRARDRLYLSAVLDQYRLKRTARAFSGLLPESLADAFADAASGSDVVQWSSPEGPFDLAVCEVRPPVAAIAEPVAPDDVVQVNAVTVSGVEANSVSAFVAGAGPGRPAAAARAGRTGDRLIGTLVHRLFQRDPDPALPADALATIVAGLVGDAERVDVDRFDEVVENAVAAWRRVREDADLVALFATGRRDYEVPFSFRAPSPATGILRGVIDCLVSHPDGRLTVVEVKTGDPRPEHDRQARLYAEAVSAAFNDSPVAIKIVYSGPCG